MKQHYTVQGFSLTEYLIIFSVILVIGIVVQTWIHPVEKIQIWLDDKKKSDLLLMVNALEQYREINGSYPQSDSNYRIDNLLDGVQWGAVWDDKYIHKLPIDTDFRKSYAYYSPPGGSFFYLYASLERGGQDKDACHPDGSACDSIKAYGIDPNACGENSVCNYSVSSSNAYMR